MNIENNSEMEKLPDKKRKTIINYGSFRSILVDLYGKLLNQQFIEEKQKNAAVVIKKAKPESTEDDLLQFFADTLKEINKSQGN